MREDFGKIISFLANSLANFKYLNENLCSFSENLENFIIFCFFAASATILIVPGAAILTGFLVDYIGRISTLKSAAVPYIAGWLLIANASNFMTLLIGRFLTGFALGTR